MMQPRPAPNCVRRWSCGARSSSKWRIEKWCPHACADRSNKRQTVQRCSRDQTTPDHSRYCRRQCSRQNDDHARARKHPRRQLRHARLHRRLSQIRPEGTRGARHHGAASRGQLHGRDRAAPGASALRSADPQAGVRPRHRHPCPTRVCPATPVRHRRGPVGLYHPNHAAVLRCQSLSCPAGRDAEAVENQARYDQARLHHRAGAQGTRGPGSRLARLYPPPEGVSPQEAGRNLNVRLVLRPTIPHPDLSYLVDSNHPDSGVRLILGRDDGRPVDFLEIDGDVAAQHATELENAIWQHLPDLRPVAEDQIGNYLDRAEKKHSAPHAVTQLLITYHLLRKYSDLSQLPFAPPVAALSRLGSMPTPLSLSELGTVINTGSK